MPKLSHGYQLELFPAERTSGELALIVLVRRTFAAGLESAVVQPLEDCDQPPPLLADVHEGDPAETPACQETDVVPEKAKVDVLILGKAYAPEGKAVTEFECAVQIGKRREVLRIVGPRRVIPVPPKKDAGKWVPQTPRFAAPTPIAELPLSLRYAYGGWTWLIPDDETLRVQREVAKVMQEEAAVKAASAPAAPKRETAKDAKAAAVPKPGEQPVEEAEILKRGDGSEGFDREGVRLWNASASNDGTAVLSLEEFERQDLAQQAAALRQVAAPPPETHGKRQNARGEWLETDDGAEVLTPQKWAEIAAAEAAAAAVVPVQAPDEPAEVVVNGDGTRVLRSVDGEETDDRSWDHALRQQVADEDARTAGARKKQAEERRKAEDEALAEFARLPCPSNPFGRGYCVSNHPKVLERLELPQIEHPAAPLTPGDLVRDPLDWEKTPQPAGFGVYPRQAMPRIQLCGPLPSSLGDWEATLEAQKRALDLTTRSGQEALKVLEAREKPHTMRPGYYNSAMPTMQLHSLRGDEDVVLENLTKDGRLYFRLPAKAPIAELERGRGVERQDLVLDTLVIDAEKAQVSLVWRAAFALGSWDELSTYPQLAAHVLDWDLEDKRKAQFQPQRQEGTAIMDLGEVPFEVAVPTVVESVRASDDALELPKEGTYLQADDSNWQDNADALAQAAAERRAAEQAELAWRAQKAAALAELAAGEQAEAARRAEVGAAVAAGKPVPPAGGKAKKG